MKCACFPFLSVFLVKKTLLGVYLNEREKSHNAENPGRNKREHIQALFLTFDSLLLDERKKRIERV